MSLHIMKYRTCALMNDVTLKVLVFKRFAKITSFVHHTASYLSAGIPVPLAIPEREELNQQQHRLCPNSCIRLLKKTKSDPSFS